MVASRPCWNGVMTATVVMGLALVDPRQGRQHKKGMGPVGNVVVVLDQAGAVCPRCGTRVRRDRMRGRGLLSV